MIATVQPAGLHSPFGGPRILRALLRGGPEPFVSVCTATTPPPPTDAGLEVFLPVRPHYGRLESTRFGVHLWRLAPLSAGDFARKLEALFRERGVRAVHCIPHGLDFYHAFVVAKRLNLRYVINCHDELEYNLRGRHDLPEAEKRLAEVWREADARLVISEAMGREYCRRFGDRSWDRVTDGLKSVPNAPKSRPKNSLRVYFAGAVHRSYHPNFHALAEALSRFAAERQDWKVSLTIRGYPPEMKATIPITTLPWGTEREVAQDMEDADLLYLPLPFGKEDASFVRYSLSTKMVTYLGSGLPILYHGPEDAAARRLLTERGAALALSTLNAAEMAQELAKNASSQADIAANALPLARETFLLERQRRKFWGAMGAEYPITDAANWERTPALAGA